MTSMLLCGIVFVTLLYSIQAADCTSSQIADLTSLQSNVTSVCGSDALSSTTSTTTYCNDSECLAYLTSMISSIPSCEINSYNLRTVLTTAIRSCDATSDAVPASKSSAQSLQWASFLLQVVIIVSIVMVLII